MEKKGILESWKEISDYLKRSVKTCQRWEEEFGLPVHRLEETPKARVYADKSELDVWIREKLHLADRSENARPRFRSLAVLPIKNLSGKAKKDYLAEGITEVLITELGQVAGLRVISHQSVKQFQETGKTIPEIAKLLRVEAFVEGALLPARNGVRLSVNLVGAFPERHIWAQTFECGEPDLAGLQRRIARTVAEQAGAALTPQVEARLASSQSVVPEAYEAYFRGRASVRKSFIKADIERALGYFEKAIALDPGFAPAYAEKGWAYGQLGHYSHLPAKTAFPKLKEAAQKALELDSLLAEGYAELGFASAMFDWAWPQAEKYLNRALELNPNSQRAHFYKAQLLSWLGRDEESLAMQHRLLELDPLNPESHWNLGWSYFWARRYDEAMVVFKRLQEAAHEDHWLEMALGVVHSLQGHAEPALAMCDRARAGVPMGVDCQFDCFTAIIYANAGEKKKARMVLHQIMKTSRQRLYDSACVAGCYVALGDTVKALAWLERAGRERSPAFVYFKVAPFWKPLLAHPLGRRILRRLNFPD